MFADTELVMLPLEFDDADPPALQHQFAYWTLKLLLFISQPVTWETLNPSEIKPLNPVVDVSCASVELLFKTLEFPLAESNQ